MERVKRTVVAIDDEGHALDFLERRIKERADLSLVLATVDGEKAKEYVERYHVDIVMVDLDLGSIHGYEIMAVLDHYTQIIVCTASATEGSNALDQGAVDFLEKPFGADRFNRAVDRAQERLRLLEQRPPVSREEVGMLPNADHSAVFRIRWDEIVYIRSHSKETSVFCTDGRVLICGVMLRQLEEWMPDYLVRVQRCFVLNIHEMESYSFRHKERWVLLKPLYQSYWQKETKP